MFWEQFLALSFNDASKAFRNSIEDASFDLGVCSNISYAFFIFMD